jgi:hypothetical protein
LSNKASEKHQPEASRRLKREDEGVRHPLGLALENLHGKRYLHTPAHPSVTPPPPTRLNTHVLQVCEAHELRGTPVTVTGT